MFNHTLKVFLLFIILFSISLSAQTPMKLEYFRKSPIQEYSQWADFKEYGKLYFATFRGLEFENSQYFNCFLIDENGFVVYEFPVLDFEKIKSVHFEDINQDGKKDIIISATFQWGNGLNGADSRSSVRIFFNKSNGFITVKELDEKMFNWDGKIFSIPEIRWITKKFGFEKTTNAIHNEKSYTKYPIKIFKEDLDLHYHCINGNYELVKAAIENGANVNKPDSKGIFPLYTAINPLKGGKSISEYNKIAKLLIRNKANTDSINQNYFGDAPLIAAVDNDNYKMLRFLLKHGANPNIFNKQSRTALMIAAIYNKSKAIKLLIKKGAFVDLKNKDGKKAIDFAEENSISYRFLKEYSN